MNFSCVDGESNPNIKFDNLSDACPRDRICLTCLKVKGILSGVLERLKNNSKMVQRKEEISQERFHSGSERFLY